MRGILGVMCRRERNALFTVVCSSATTVLLYNLYAHASVDSEGPGTDAGQEHGRAGINCASVRADRALEVRLTRDILAS